MRRLKLATLTTLLIVFGCASQTTNGVTKVTLNTNSVNAWGQAFINAANTVALLPGVSGTPAAGPIIALSGPLSTDLAAFKTATNGALTLTYDSTSPPAAVSSLLTDAQSLQTAVQSSIGNLTSSQLSTATLYLNALETVVSLFEAAASSSVAAAAPITPMTEADALKQLKVPFPSR